MAHSDDTSDSTAHSTQHTAHDDDTSDDTIIVTTHSGTFNNARAVDCVAPPLGAPA